MRLINVRTLELGEFIETPEKPHAIPPYIILSHTWGNNEVTYHEMMRPTSTTFEKEGYLKIKQFAATVALLKAPRGPSIEYVWLTPAVRTAYYFYDFKCTAD
jgi:hypothetical protein